MAAYCPPGNTPANSKKKEAPKKKAKQVHGAAKNNAPLGDSRAGRLKPVKTDRGEFRFKDNRKGGD